MGAHARVLPTATWPGRSAGERLCGLQRRARHIREAQDRGSRPADLSHRLPLPRQIRFRDRVHLLHRALSYVARKGRLEVLPGPCVLRRLHLPEARHTLRRQGRIPTRPRRQWTARVGMEEGHAAAEPQGPTGADRLGENAARGVAVPAAGRPKREANSAEQLCLLLERLPEELLNDWLPALGI